MTCPLSWHERGADVRRRAAHLTRPRATRVGGLPITPTYEPGNKPCAARLYRPRSPRVCGPHTSTQRLWLLLPRRVPAPPPVRAGGPPRAPTSPESPTPDSGYWCRAARLRRLRSPRVGGPPLSPPPVPSRRQHATPGRLGFGGPPTTSPPDSGYL